MKKKTYKSILKDDKQEYKLCATINYKDKGCVSFLREHMRDEKFKGSPTAYGLQLIQQEYPKAIIELDYIREYPNVD